MLAIHRPSYMVNMKFRNLFFHDVNITADETLHMVSDNKAPP